MIWNTLYRLDCGIRHYAWGGRLHNGKAPFIAELLGIFAAGEQPYAELWVGAHPGLPAKVVGWDDEVTLDRLIEQHPAEVLGRPLLDCGVRQLPFLLKVLNSESPLSIQAHPDLALAAKLHTQDPKHYPDANHKPEIAIGLTGVDMLCQFRARDHIRTDLERLSGLRHLFSEALAAAPAEVVGWLRTAYSFLFSAPQPMIDRALQDLRGELSRAIQKTGHDTWFLRLNRAFPGDRGAISVYFLNLVHLGPGQAIFLATGEPHAYLQGTIIECMANSDNVVRAGLTPKFIDRDVLVNMLTYRGGTPTVTAGRETDAGDTIYDPPVPEFQVELYRHAAGRAVTYSSDGMVSLMLVLAGTVRMETPAGAINAERGTAWLWPAALEQSTLTFVAAGTQVVRARPNIRLR